MNDEYWFEDNDAEAADLGEPIELWELWDLLSGRDPLPAPVLSVDGPDPLMERAAEAADIARLHIARAARANAEIGFFYPEWAATFNEVLPIAVPFYAAKWARRRREIEAGEEVAAV